MRRPSGPIARSLLLAGLVVLPLTARDAWAERDYDPFESANRAIFSFNEVVDGLVIEPASILYGYLPPPVRTGVGNVLDNLRGPVVFTNDLLQGDRDRAGVTLARFLINSTLGVLGIFDMAEQFGYSAHHEDFGQTLGVWGVGDGPYIVLPILGPSNARDTVGRIVDGLVIDPWAYVAPTEANVARRGVEGIDTRHEVAPIIDDLRANSIDRYAAMRSAYRQARASAIRNGTAPASNQEYDDIFKELDGAADAR